MIKLLLALIRPLTRIAKALEAILEVQKALLAVHGGGRGGSIFSLKDGVPGGESVHWKSEAELVELDEIRRAYEAQFGVRLKPWEHPEERWLEQNDLLQDYQALSSR